ncbi:MAG: AI-2E family transporter [archaeon]|nr:MAG: AI-2E family transporter [archaeon]
MVQDGGRKAALLIIFIALIVIAFFIVRDYIAVVLAAGVLAYILNWPFKKLSKLIKNRNIAGIIIVVVVVLGLAFLFYILAQAAIKEAFNLYLSIQKLDSYQVIDRFLTKIFGNVQITTEFSTAIQRGITSITNQFISQLGDAISNIPKILFQMFILMFVTFYFLKEGGKILASVKKVLPFKEQTSERFIERSKKITGATIYGMVIVGIIQGAVAGLGFYVFNAPSPLFFTILAMFLSILPFIGSWLVWAPVGLAMIAGGNSVNGILLIIFGLLVVGTIENIVRPLVVGRRGHINPALALIGMLGGLSLLGPIGLIIGPIILELLRMTVQTYKEKGFRKNGVKLSKKK